MNKRIWETPVMFHCPLVGHCLSTTEQRHIIKKGAGIVHNQLSDYSVHAVLIAAIEHECPVAKRVERIFNQKYRQEIQQYRDFSAPKWLEEVKNKLDHTTFGAFLWISAAWLELTIEITEEIYGMLHMFIHNQFRQQKDIIATAVRSKAEQEKIQAKYLALRKEITSIKQEKKQLQQTTFVQERLIRSLKTDIKQLKSAHSHSCAGKCKERADKLEETVRNYNQIIVKLKEERDNLKEELHKQSNILVRLQNDIHSLLNPVENEKCRNEDCPHYDLCARKVLIVGGVSKLRSFYKKVVNDLGGQFEYHNGSLKKGEDMLLQQITRSDIVLCPVDVNSHAACLTVKKHSKKLGKAYFMLDGSGTSAIYNKLREIAGSPE